MDCLFCKIAKKEIPGEILYEDKNLMVLKDIHPKAPLHLLIITKKHIEWEDKFKKKDLFLLSQLLSIARKTAIKHKIDKAYKLVFNAGKTGHISHIHLHLLGGWKKYT